MVHKSVQIQSILKKMLQRQQFNKRVNTGKLSEMWSNIFGNELGELVKRDGDILYVNVKGAPLKAECENFRKWEILDTLHTMSEFSSIRDIRFMEI
jgi:hypothetical protein